MGYLLYLTISDRFINKHNLEGFESKNQDIKGYDPNSINLRKKMNQDISMVGDSKVDENCLPFRTDQIPGKKTTLQDDNYLIEEKNDLKGHNFLYPGYHSQNNTYGISSKNKKQDLRAEPVNPQLGVDPWTQSRISVDYKNDPKTLNNPKQFDNNLWNRLISEEPTVEKDFQELLDRTEHSYLSNSD